MSFSPHGSPYGTTKNHNSDRPAREVALAFHRFMPIVRKVHAIISKRAIRVKQAVMGIVVGGGPAPGINGVIGAAAIEAVNNGMAVLGFYDGFAHLAAEQFDPAKHVTELTIANTSRIHFDGGSILRTARASLLDQATLAATKAARPDPQRIRRVCDRLTELGVTHLLTIGGDDTAMSARFIAESMKDRIRIVHAPKTIDNDLPLPGDTPTFGFTTARHEGSAIIANLMEDSRTTQRWYITVTMGRNTGFLALGIGKSAGATLTIIPEEFPSGTTIREIADIIEGSILKRRVAGRHDGVAVLAEGLAYQLGDRAELSELLGHEVPVDAAGHPRLSEVSLALLLKEEVSRRFANRHDKLTIIGHEVGYELRCARPATSDLCYTRDIGHGGVRLLLESETNLSNGVMVTLQDGNLVPIPFSAMVDPATNRTAIRRVDMKSYSYTVARAYMIRLEKGDFTTPKTLAALATEAKMTPQQFRERFEYVVENAPEEGAD